MTSFMHASHDCMSSILYMQELLNKHAVWAQAVKKATPPLIHPTTVQFVIHQLVALNASYKSFS